jgi:hypothetical protein
VPRVRHLIATLLALALVVSLAVAPAAGAASAPKVVLVVGPVGATTDRYRELADEAAAEARRLTPNVVRVYSPDATWPAVRRALQGASIVVYLGHGNGWPSPHRGSLYPPTQNGFGLNPTAGGDDSSHQYFGEAAIAASVRLAPNAVVLLHHLCYASGNSEPGLPEGGEDLARQRVDNFAAGFLRAGAAAVIAEAHAGPAFFVRQLLTARGSVDAIWRTSPTFNDNVFRFASRRTPGFVAQMDPDRAESGFHRSIVFRPGLRASDVRDGARGSVSVGLPGDLPTVLPHTLVDLGLEVDPPALVDAPVAGRRTGMAIGYRTAGDPLPDGIRVGIRWDPIDIPLTYGTPAALEPAADEPGASAAAAEDTAAADETAAEPPADAPAANAAPQAPAPQAPSPSEPPAPAPGPRLVVAESPGSVVAPVAARVSKKVLLRGLRMPAAPGMYRLVTTLHDSDGVAYDAETQSLVPALIVRVAAPIDAHYAVAPLAEVERGGQLQLPITIRNLGANRWGDPQGNPQPPRRGDEPEAGVRLVARWVPLQLSATPADASSTWVNVTQALAPGSAATVTANLSAPRTPGDYLLILDVVLSGQRSLTAAGVPPGLVRVVVR